MTQQIQLTQGQVATVCDCCYYKVKDYKWFAHWNHHTQSFYAERQSKRSFGKQKPILMHGIVNGTPAGMLTDHIDGNTLNNCCSNLRAATYIQNGANQERRSNNKSGYKGVSWKTHSRKWCAQIRANGKVKHIGYFSSPEKAARAYDNVAKEMYGEFARPNF